MEPHDAEMDGLLRRTMAAPIPNLPPDFDRRLLREVHRGSKPLDGYRRILLSGYGVTSVVASVMVMHGHGLEWGAIAVMIAVPLGLIAAGRFVRRANQTA